MTQRILVIEDEDSIAEAIAARLRAEGFEVAIAGDGPTGVERFAELAPDLVVLDLMLPGFDGLEVCRRIQATRPAPVIMLTARDSETDMLVGLGVGADDYITKPFSPRELVARVKALIRRIDLERRSPVADVLKFDDVRIDTARRKVSAGSGDVHLTATEFDLLCTFAARPGTVFTRAQLLGEVWGYAESAGERTVDSHVASLRRKLGAGAIRTVHGVGYALGEQT
jgi:DNA-binding response OmpR family regulator